MNKGWTTRGLSPLSSHLLRHYFTSSRGEQLPLEVQYRITQRSHQVPVHLSLVSELHPSLAQTERGALFSGCRLHEVEDAKEQCMMGQKGSWDLRASLSRRCSSDRESTWRQTSRNSRATSPRYLFHWQNPVWKMNSSFDELPLSSVFCSSAPAAHRSGRDKWGKKEGAEIRNKHITDRAHDPRDINENHFVYWILCSPVSQSSL